MRLNFWGTKVFSIREKKYKCKIKEYNTNPYILNIRDISINLS